MKQLGQKLSEINESSMAEGKILESEENREGSSIPHQTSENENESGDNTQGSKNGEFYFSCHERMLNDNASKDNIPNMKAHIFSDSFYEENLKGNSAYPSLGLRETQSMPDLSKTMLNSEIEYSLANYKLNESSKISDPSPSSEKDGQNSSKFMSSRYNRMDEEVQPKFMTTLNSARKQDLNRSDEFEAKDIIDSINYIESCKFTL